MTREEIQELRDLIMERRDLDGFEASEVIGKSLNKEARTVYGWMYTAPLPLRKTQRKLERMLTKERRLANATI
jgi:hypothetical protein